jgi:gluconate 2-dehydrogenase gamma chain
MNRREILQRSALMLGYAISGPTLAGILNGCKASPELAFTPSFFSEDQARLVSELSEIIIPKTGTPGAKDAGVPGFIDSMLKGVYSKKDQDSFLKGLEEFDQDARKTFGASFINCKPEDQVAQVSKHHDAALSDSKGATIAAWWVTGGEAEKPFIIKMKELTLIGFFSSEPGATEVLQYNQIPGPFKGCVPLAQVGKTWAT